MFNPVYANQVRLLLRVLPLIEKQRCFALKGGTAINLFVQDMPRLSVDIDLTYLPLIKREAALTEISKSLAIVGKIIKESFPGTNVQQNPKTSRLVVHSAEAQIKVEPNTVFRGAIHEPVSAVICDNAQIEFEQFVECQMLAIPDLYGSKICAALDRQHPRDLFDIHLMLEKIGLTDDIRRAFVVYLAGHPRPMAEVLFPNEQPLEDIFNKQFLGMTKVPITLETLIETRAILIDRLQRELTENERAFLISLKQGEPDWQLMSITHLEQLPAIQWKLQNIKRMPKQKHQESLDKLKRVLNA